MQQSPLLQSHGEIGALRHSPSDRCDRPKESARIPRRFVPTDTDSGKWRRRYRYTTILPFASAAEPALCILPVPDCRPTIRLANASEESVTCIASVHESGEGRNAGSY